MDITPYLHRIGYYNKVKADSHTLKSLQWQHLFHVPFEDIDVHCNTPVKLDEASVFNKIVLKKRGGYCYELNSLFAALLREIGFDVSLLSARVKRGNTYGDDCDHMALLVVAEGERWLADVGFGNFSLKPLSLSEGIVQNDSRDDYRIAEFGVIDGQRFFAAERFKLSLQQFVAEYIFSLQPRSLADFASKNLWQQSNEASHFVQNFICSKPTGEGRLSIINYHFIQTDAVSKRQRVISGAERKRLLKECFGIDIDG